MYPPPKLPASKADFFRLCDGVIRKDAGIGEAPVFRIPVC